MKLSMPGEEQLSYNFGVKRLCPCPQVAILVNEMEVHLHIFISDGCDDVCDVMT